MATPRSRGGPAATWRPKTDLFNIVALNLWLAFAFLCGRLAWCGSRSRALAIALGALLAAAPYWNVPASWWRYQQAVRRDGGVHVPRPLAIDSLLVSAPGAGDPLRRCSLSSYCGAVLDGHLAAAEFAEQDTGSATARFVRLSRSSRGDPRCAELDGIATVGRHDFWTLKPGECFATERLAEAGSRYEVEVRDDVDSAPWPLGTVFGREVLVRDRSTGEVVARSRHYASHPRPFWPALPQVGFDDGVRDLSIEQLRAGTAR